MKKILFSFFFISLFSLHAQDFDIYKKDINTNFKFPSIPQEMSYEEFKILSTQLRMQDIGIAMVLPGHVHFKINEKKTGYYLLGTRIVGFAGMIYMSINGQSVYNTVFKDNLSLKVSASDKIISYGSIFLIGGSFLYDWIHGKYLLEQKQTHIRYKYSKKKIRTGISFIESQHKLYPGLIFKYTF